MTSSFRVAYFPARSVAYLTFKIPDIGNIEILNKSIEKLVRVLHKRGVKIQDMDNILVFTDGVFPDFLEERKIKIGLMVPFGTKFQGKIKSINLPEGKYAIGSFEIFPENYGKAWEQTHNFLRNNNLNPVEGVNFTLFKNLNSQNKKGKQHLDICFALDNERDGR